MRTNEFYEELKNLLMAEVELDSRGVCCLIFPHNEQQHCPTDTQRGKLDAHKSNTSPPLPFSFVLRDSAVSRWRWSGGWRWGENLLVLPVEVAPLSTEVLDAGYGVFHQLRAERDALHRVPNQTVRDVSARCRDFEFTLQWISALMVSRLRLVLRTLMYSINGRMLMPCGEEEDGWFGSSQETLEDFQMIKTKDWPLQKVNK